MYAGADRGDGRVKHVNRVVFVCVYLSLNCVSLLFSSSSLWRSSLSRCPISPGKTRGGAPVLETEEEPIASIELRGRVKYM